MKKARIERIVAAILALLILASCAHIKGSSSSSNAAKEEWKLGAAVIPENNPDPVLVNREDAAIPTPISYTDKIVGEQMDVEIKILELSSNGNEQWGNHIAVISSHSELQAVYDQEYNQYFNDKDNYVKFYDDIFFKDRVIIMLISRTASSAFKYKIDKVTTHNESMYIYWNNADLSKDELFVAEGADYRTFISVSKKDMENITDIVVYEDDLYCE